MFTVYSARGVIIDSGNENDLRKLCNKYGFPYRDTILGITEAGEHAHNGMLITSN